VNFGFNVSLGREVELYNRVKSNDPSTAGLVLMILALSGIEADAAMKDRTTFADILSASTIEVTNTGYTREVFTDADLDALVVDHTNNQILIAVPLVSFGGPNVAAGDTWEKAILGYDPDTTGGADSAIIPITAHDVRFGGSAIVPNGSPAVVDLSAGFAVAR